MSRMSFDEDYQPDFQPSHDEYFLKSIDNDYGFDDDYYDEGLSDITGMNDYSDYD